MTDTAPFIERVEQRDGFLVPRNDNVCFSACMKTLPDLALAVSHCAQKRIAVQAGGNVGVWARGLAHEFATVYSFEPDPLNFRCLTSNTPDNVVCLQAALSAGSQETPCTLKSIPGNIGAHETNRGEIGVYPSMQIDELHLPGCDLIYLDIEGDELSAFFGAFSTIAKFSPVIGFEDKGVKGTVKGEVADFLAGLGYKVIATPNRDVIMTRTGG